MAKRTESAVEKVGPDASYLSKFLETDTSLSNMDSYVIVPRFKIIQQMTDAELKKRVGEGSVIIKPGDAVVWKEGDPPFQFVPLFFFPEWTIMSDRRDKDSPMFLSRTFDPSSKIAKAAADPQLRSVPYEGHEGRPEKDQWKRRYVEHLRFIGLIYGDHDLVGTPVTLSFEKGEYYNGRDFISAIKYRKHLIDGKRSSVPLWSQIWNFHVSLRPSDDGSWYGFDFTPPEVKIIKPEEVEEFYAQHCDLRDAHQEQRIRVDGDEHEEERAEDGDGEF